jgi:hypothetical protein
LRLDKKEYRAVTAALTAKTGKPVELLDTKRDSLDPTVTSSNVDETVAFPIKKVAVALRHSMDRVGCNVQMETSSSMQCRRKHGNSSLIGPGGETVTASLESQAAGTRIRIVSKRTAVRHRNWSTPIYAEMKRELESLQ